MRHLVLIAGLVGLCVPMAAAFGNGKHAQVAWDGRGTGVEVATDLATLRSGDGPLKAYVVKVSTALEENGRPCLYFLANASVVAAYKEGFRQVFSRSAGNQTNLLQEVAVTCTEPSCSQATNRRVTVTAKTAPMSSLDMDNIIINIDQFYMSGEYSQAILGNGAQNWAPKPYWYWTVLDRTTDTKSSSVGFTPDCFVGKNSSMPCYSSEWHPDYVQFFDTPFVWPEKNCNYIPANATFPSTRKLWKVKVATMLPDDGRTCTEFLADAAAVNAYEQGFRKVFLEAANNSRRALNAVAVTCTNPGCSKAKNRRATVTAVAGKMNGTELYAIMEGVSKSYTSGNYSKAVEASGAQDWEAIPFWQLNIRDRSHFDSVVMYFNVCIVGDQYFRCLKDPIRDRGLWRPDGASLMRTPYVPGPGDC